MDLGGAEEGLHWSRGGMDFSLINTHDRLRQRQRHLLYLHSLQTIAITSK